MKKQAGPAKKAPFKDAQKTSPIAPKVMLKKNSKELNDTVRSKAFHREQKAKSDARMDSIKRTPEYKKGRALDSMANSMLRDGRKIKAFAGKASDLYNKGRSSDMDSVLKYAKKVEGTKDKLTKMGYYKKKK